MLAEEAMLARCAELDVREVVRDPDSPHGSGVGEALERIAAGDASTLLVGRLGAVAGSLRELVALLDWLAAAEGHLVALDVNLDTASTAGRRTIAVLREAERWEHERKPGRPRRGRPGLAARAPELSRRIADMRARGLSLQAIADALNDDGVPTPRGGLHWRPSSVQSALGYLRPRPSLPGAPPAPQHGPGRPPPPHGAREKVSRRPRGQGPGP
jgi:DNA invertase Pin-like site-specific DNA recombinase